MGMTLAEKILARASGQKEVVPGQYVTAEIDLCMAHEGLAAVFMNMARAGWSRVWDPSRIVSVLDHYVPAPTERSAEVHKVVRTAVKQWGIQHFYGERAGICHQILPEKGHVLPWHAHRGTDSHTTTYGAFGAAGTGIGFTNGLRLRHRATLVQGAQTIRFPKGKASRESHVQGYPPLYRREIFGRSGSVQGGGV